MIRITEEHIDAVYDTITSMRLFSQVLSEGEVDDMKASEISWLLGSAQKRLEPIINVLEEIQFDQEGGAERKPVDDVLELGTEMLALWEKFSARRAGGKS